jgi:sugar phosphate isomerase/epimerase
MTLEQRMDKIEKALGSNDTLVRELRDAVTVTAQLEARQGRVLKEHSDWLESHDRAMKEHDERMKEHHERMQELDARIANLVSGFGEFMRRTRAPE